MMEHPGVRFPEIEYLGRDYMLYRKSMLGEIQKESSFDKVEHKISPRYNEVMVLSKDEYDGIEVIENQRHGLMFKFEEM